MNEWKVLPVQVCKSRRNSMDACCVLATSTRTSTVGSTCGASSQLSFFPFLPFSSYLLIYYSFPFFNGTAGQIRHAVETHTRHRASHTLYMKYRYSSLSTRSSLL